MWTTLNSFMLSLYTRVQLKRDEGQALVEYTLILALVSIIGIGVLALIGEKIGIKLKVVEEALK
jgi:Flp pilus assembly pilin Flp